MNRNVFPRARRDPVVERFESSDGETPELLPPLRQGQRIRSEPRPPANHVFPFDRWWNSAVENQAKRTALVGSGRNTITLVFLVFMHAPAPNVSTYAQKSRYRLPIEYTYSPMQRPRPSDPVDLSGNERHIHSRLDRSKGECTHELELASGKSATLDTAPSQTDRKKLRA